MATLAASHGPVSKLIEGLRRSSLIPDPPSESDTTDIRIPTLKFKLKKCDALQGGQKALDTLGLTSKFGIKVVGIAHKEKHGTIYSKPYPGASSVLKKGSLLALYLNRIEH